MCLAQHHAGNDARGHVVRAAQAGAGAKTILPAGAVDDLAYSLVGGGGEEEFGPIWFDASVIGTGVQTKVGEEVSPAK